MIDNDLRLAHTMTHPSNELRRLNALLAIVGLGVVAHTTAAAGSVTRGPYLQRATPTGVTVVWRTDNEITPVVRYGSSPQELDGEVDGESVLRRVSVDVAAATDALFGSTPLLYDEPQTDASRRRTGERDPSTQEQTWQYEAELSGLTPASRYYYAVYDGNKLLAGGAEDHSFSTSPEPSERADLRVWVVGDSGTGGRDQQLVFDAMRTFTERTGRALDAFLHVGDMAYGDGTDTEFQTHFFDVYQPTLRNTVCWPAMGNHEGHTSRGVSQFGPYYDAYVLPTGGESGGVASGTEAYYSFDLGKAHFVCLDSHDLDRSPSAAMAQWLLADLEQANSDWLIAFWHHPPYTKGSHDSDHERQLIEMREYFMPLLEAHGVDLVLSGHSHIYERSMLINGAYATPTVAEGVVLDDGDGDPNGDGPYRKSEGLQPHNGTIAIVAGHGGAGVSRKGTMPIMREITVENGSLVLDFEGDTLTGTMINKYGETRDRFQLTKHGVVEHKPIAEPWQPVHDPSLITEQRISWTPDDVGGFPPSWVVVEGDESLGMVETRPGTTWQQLSLKTAEDELVTAYEGFTGPIAEIEAYFEFHDSDASAPAGLVFGMRPDGSHFRFALDPVTGVASLIRISGGKTELISQREVSIAFDKPIKIELEPGEGLLEVQLNDEIEYTAPLESIPPGRVGVALAPNGAIHMAGLLIEKAR